jgi:hypothetical protein
MIKKKNKTVENVPQVIDDNFLWKQFVQMVSAHVDPVLASMLYGTELICFDRIRQVVEVVTLKKFILFQDLFLEQKHVYQEYLNKLFGYQVTLVVQFTKIEIQAPVPIRMVSTVSDIPVVPKSSMQVPVSFKKPGFMAPAGSMSRRQQSQPAAQLANNERTLDVSDTKKWKITHTLLDHFGGTVREIVKETDEFNA